MLERFRAKPDEHFQAMLMALPIESVQKIIDACAGTHNNDHKLQAITKQFFHDELSQLSRTKNKILNMESLLRDLVELVFAGEYANSSGVYQWQKFTTVITQVIRIKGQAEGAEAAASRMQA